MSLISLSRPTRMLFLVVLTGMLGAPAWAADPWVVFEGQQGPGKGKHIVLVSGDE